MLLHDCVRQTVDPCPRHWSLLRFVLVARLSALARMPTPGPRLGSVKGDASRIECKVVRRKPVHAQSGCNANRCCCVATTFSSSVAFKPEDQGVKIQDRLVIREQLDGTVQNTQAKTYTDACERRWDRLLSTSAKPSPDIPFRSGFCPILFPSSSRRERLAYDFPLSISSLSLLSQAPYLLLGRMNGILSIT